MAKTEEQKAARRVRRAIARKEREEKREEMWKLFRQRMNPSPYDNITCYRCHEKGHYATVCKEKRKRIKNEAEEKRSHPEIVCFKCREKGHFFSHCPKAKEKSCALPRPRRGSTICFHCKQEGHTAKRCQERQRGKQAVMRPARASSEKIVWKDGSVLYLCKKCNRLGHVDAECPVVLEQHVEGFIPEDLP